MFKSVLIKKNVFKRGENSGSFALFTLPIQEGIDAPSMHSAVQFVRYGG